MTCSHCQGGGSLGVDGNLGCADNKQSLEVEFEHLVLWSQKLALAVVDAPKAVLGILDAAAKEAVLEDWPEFRNIHQDIFVRFPTLSVIDSIRNLRCGCDGACGNLWRLQPFHRVLTGAGTCSTPLAGAHSCAVYLPEASMGPPSR